MKESNSVSQLYIVADNTPSRTAKTTRGSIPGMNRIRTWRQTQIRASGRRNEKITFPTPPSLLMRSRASFAMKCALPRPFRCSAMGLNRFLKRFVRSGYSTVTKSTDTAAGIRMRIRDRRSGSGAGSRKKAYGGRRGTPNREAANPTTASTATVPARSATECA